MRHFTLKSLEFHNFKGFKDSTIEFGNDRTTIAACNGLGKSTIGCGFIWLFSDYDYDMNSRPKVRREVNKFPVNDVDVSVKAVLDIDGKEVTAEKIQHRTIAKKDGSITDTNKYLVNSCPKTLKEFNAYFDMDTDTFLLCSNINAFLNKKQKDMREFLFSLVEDIKDSEIAAKDDSLKELVPLLENYSKEELIAMKSSEKRKIQKELDSVQPRIDEVNRSIVEVDVKGLQSKADDLKKQIAEIEKQESDSEIAFSEVEKLNDEIFKLRMDANSIEQKANDKLRLQRREIQRRIDDANDEFQEGFREKRQLESKISSLESTIKSNEEYKLKLADDWRNAYKMQLDPNNLVCPTCGREYESDKVDEVKASFENSRKNRINDIAKAGNDVKSAIEKDKAALEELKAQTEPIKDKMLKANGKKSLAMQELNNLPDKADVSKQADFLEVQLLLNSKIEQLKSMDTGADYRQQLKVKRIGLKEELESVEREMMQTESNEKSKRRIEELRENAIKNEQAKANCEKILYLLDELDKKKNELFVDEINSHFSIVKWDLFELNKNGSYKKDFCVPTVDGYRLNDTMNKGRAIAAKIDIANSIQKIKEISLPIFLDDAESINDWNIPQVDSQLVLLKVTGDKELKVEV